MTFSTTSKPQLYCHVYFQESKSTSNASVSNILRQVLKVQFHLSGNTQTHCLCKLLGSPNPQRHFYLSEMSTTLLFPSAWLCCQRRNYLGLEDSWPLHLSFLSLSGTPWTFLLVWLAPPPLASWPCSQQLPRSISRAAGLTQKAQQVSQGLMLNKVPIRKCDLGSAAIFQRKCPTSSTSSLSQKIRTAGFYSSHSRGDLKRGSRACYFPSRQWLSRPPPFHSLKYSQGSTFLRCKNWIVDSSSQYFSTTK